MLLEILDVVLLPIVLVVMGCIPIRYIKKQPRLTYRKMDFSEKE